ncbi:hypothetical protein EYF80_047745 [Liparis tanakae]|uniref:Uncharacterized protein n=1 Tax=Liparis tanakae TaxID=230148 RepID=A0A4Z2FMC6_9TELE|nr:hypothetical protein EYF80_047745 [Liparis tanakae]
MKRLSTRSVGHVERQGHGSVKRRVDTAKRKSLNKLTTYYCHQPAGDNRKWFHTNSSSAGKERERACPAVQSEASSVAPDVLIIPVTPEEDDSIWMSLPASHWTA